MRREMTTEDRWERLQIALQDKKRAEAYQPILAHYTELTRQALEARKCAS